MRFCALPFDGLPIVNSKIRRAPEATIEPLSDRKAPNLDGMTAAVTALRRGSMNDNMYDYDLEKSIRAPLARNIQFDKLGKRFDNNGIFGDAFDNNKNQRFGSPIADCANHDRAILAKTTLVKPRIEEAKKFEHYVLRNVEVFEAQDGS